MKKSEDEALQAFGAAVIGDTVRAAQHAVAAAQHQQAERMHTQWDAAPKRLLFFEVDEAGRQTGRATPDVARALHRNGSPVPCGFEVDPEAAGRPRPVRVAGMFTGDIDEANRAMAGSGVRFADYRVEAHCFHSADSPIPMPPIVERMKADDPERYAAELDAVRQQVVHMPPTDAAIYAIAKSVQALADSMSRVGDDADYNRPSNAPTALRAYLWAKVAEEQPRQVRVSVGGLYPTEEMRRHATEALQATARTMPAGLARARNIAETTPRRPLIGRGAPYYDPPHDPILTVFDTESLDDGADYEDPVDG